jgi:hypothetical protein
MGVSGFLLLRVAVTQTVSYGSALRYLKKCQILSLECGLSDVHCSRTGHFLILDCMYFVSYSVITQKKRKLILSTSNSCYSTIDWEWCGWSYLSDIHGFIQNFYTWTITTCSFLIPFPRLLLLFIFYCNWVDTRWQQYSTHLHTNSTQVDTRWQQYSTHLHTNSTQVDTLWQQYSTHLHPNSTQVDTLWQQYSTHLHPNSTQNTENGTYVKWTRIKLGSAGLSPSLQVVPWHLPYNWGKSTEKPQRSWKVPRYPGGSSPVHIYSQTIHRTTQWDGINRTEHTRTEQ